MLKHSLLEYVLTHNQPFVGILIGAALLAFVAFMNWYGDIKANTVGWLAKRFYRNSYQSDKAANPVYGNHLTIPYMGVPLHNRCLLFPWQCHRLSFDYCMKTKFLRVDPGSC
jgi:hypothetical protein